VWDGVYTAEQSGRGHSVYHSQCETCHGETLAGGDEVPPIAGGQFLANWNGLTVGDLFERIRKTMPLNDPGKLTAQQTADVLAYLFDFNMFPAGKTELPHEAEVLKQIRIEATKPDRHPDSNREIKAALNRACHSEESAMLLQGGRTRNLLLLASCWGGGSTARSVSSPGHWQRQACSDAKMAARPWRDCQPP
jgi:hypothetical protein